MEDHIHIETEEVIYLLVGPIGNVFVDGLHPTHGDLLPLGVTLDGDDAEEATGAQEDSGNGCRVVGKEVIVYLVPTHKELFS